MANAFVSFRLGSAAPTSTDEYNEAGALVFNNAPTSGGVLGWTCKTAGRPGTWVPFGVVDQTGVTTLTAAAALTIGKGVQLISLSAGATMTLAAAASHAAGFGMSIKNLANNSVTIATVAGATYSDAAAITLAQYAVVKIVGDGALWYKAA